MNLNQFNHVQAQRRPGDDHSRTPSRALRYDAHVGSRLPCAEVPLAATQHRVNINL
jgi:hypothetical protein